MEEDGRTDPETQNGIYDSITGKPLCYAHPQLQEDLILIKNELGIKEYQNGERDKQIQHATQRIQQIGERAEDEDKTIKDEVLILKTEFGWIKKLQWAIFIMLLGLLGTIIFFFIEFNWKTFVLGI